MTNGVVELRFEWSPLSIDGVDRDACRLAESRMRDELESWRGTRWASGGSVKGRSVDCVRFVTSVLDAMFGTDVTSGLGRWAQDMPRHQPERARHVMEEVLSLYPSPSDVIDGGVLEPGDVIVTGRGTRGGPHHPLIVGPDPRTTWHCYRSVARAGFGVRRGTRVLCVYRIGERHRWASR